MTDERDEEEVQEEIARKRLGEAVERLSDVAKLQWLMEQETFRDFMWEVLAHCHVFKSSFDTNYGRMALTEGERNVGLWLMGRLADASPDQLIAMQQKAHRAVSERSREQREKDAKRPRN